MNLLKTQVFWVLSLDIAWINRKDASQKIFLKLMIALKLIVVWEFSQYLQYLSLDNQITKLCLLFKELPILVNLWLKKFKNLGSINSSLVLYSDFNNLESSFSLDLLMKVNCWLLL